jgi:hypothetical protein
MKEDPIFREMCMAGSAKGASKYWERVSNEPGLREKMLEVAKSNGKKAAKRINTREWVCTETGYISTAAGLTHYQRKRGVNTRNRRKLDNPVSRCEELPTRKGKTLESSK